MDSLQGTTSDGQGQGSQDSAMGTPLSQLLSRSTPTSQTALPMAVNSTGGIQTSRSPGMGGIMNMNMNKNQMVATLSNKAATSSHLNMNDALVSSASFSISGANNTGQLGGVTNSLGMKPNTMGAPQMIGNVGSLNIPQQMPNQMMNGPTSFSGGIGQMRGMQSNSVNVQVPQTGMMQNPGMSPMQGHQMPGHPGMNMPQNPTQAIRVSIFIFYEIHFSLYQF